MDSKSRGVRFAVASVLATGLVIFAGGAAHGLKINSITITVTPNPYHNNATVTATFNVAALAWQCGNVKLTINLWDDDSGARDGDDKLGSTTVIVPPGGGIPDQTWNLTCTGTDVTGPLASSGENTAELFVQVEGHAAKSQTVDVTQTECDVARHEMNGPSSEPVGEMCLVEFAISEDYTLENVEYVDFGVTYDETVLAVLDAAFVHPVLAEYGTVDTSSPGTVMFMTEELPTGTTVAGPVVEMHVSIIDEAPVGVETPLQYTPGSTYGGPFILSFYDNHTITVLPPDVTPPQFTDISSISISQYEVAGPPGSVWDDWQHLPNDIQVELYHGVDSLVAFAVADAEGSFAMDHFWLQRGSQATLRAYDLLGHCAEFMFTVPTSYIPVATAGPDASGAPGEEVQVDFEVFNRCDLSETYDVSVHSARGWDVNPSSLEVTLESFAATTVSIWVGIPEGTQEATVDTVMLEAVSTTDPPTSDVDSLTVTATVTGVGEEVLSPRPAEVSSLAQNYPNPFRSSTSISYALEERGPVELAIFDIQGELVRVLVSDIQSRGTHTVTWDGTDHHGGTVTSGIYFCQLKAHGGIKATRKVLLSR